MDGLDIFAALQIRNGAGHFDDAIVTSRSQTQSIKGLLHKRSAGFVQCGEFPHFLRAHAGVAHIAITDKALVLALASRIHSLFNFCRGFGLRAVTQLLKFHRRHFHNDIDSVQ